MTRLRKAYARFERRFTATLCVLSVCLDVISAMAALMCLTLMAVYVGFDRDTIAMADIRPWLRTAQGVFITGILFRLIFMFRTTLRENKTVKWVMDTAMLFTLLPLVYPCPTHPWLPEIARLIYSPYLTFGIIAMYSAMILSFQIIKGLGRRLNPTMILAVSFLFFITCGTLLMMMPKCTYGGIDFTDSLFVSTSAVCITGLTTVDVATTFTPLGSTIIAIMMQIGALGVMTFTSVFALFFSGSTSIYSQLMVKDMIYSKTINTLLPTLLLICLFTLSVEAVGAVAVFWSIHDTIPGMTPGDEIAFSAFHSISAFCNAGFSTLPGGMSNPALLHGNQLIYLITSVIVVAGGIGYPILVNARDAMTRSLHRLWRHIRRRPQKEPKLTHLMNLNTRVVLVATGWLLLIGTVAFFLLERHNSLAEMSPWQQMVQSLFNAVTPRSAGFSSVSPAGFMNVTIVMLLALMTIGGASQSTAGGIKVNTVATAWLHLRSTISGSDRVTAWNRTLSAASVNRAQSVILLAVTSALVFTITLMLMEPELPARMLIFESISALFTVGSSLGATPLLGIPAKILLCAAMFIGRMGLLSLLAGLIGSHRYSALQYPSDNIIIS